jgi:hypothetical protein
VLRGHDLHPQRRHRSDGTGEGLGDRGHGGALGAICDEPRAVGVEVDRVAARVGRGLLGGDGFFLGGGGLGDVRARDTPGREGREVRRRRGDGAGAARSRSPGRGQRGDTVKRAVGATLTALLRGTGAVSPGIAGSAVSARHPHPTNAVRKHALQRLLGRRIVMSPCTARRW